MYGVYFLERYTDTDWVWAFSEEDKDLAVKLASTLKTKYRFYATRCVKDCRLKTIRRTEPEEAKRRFGAPRVADTANMKRRRLATHMARQFNLDREAVLSILTAWDRLSATKQMDLINPEDA